MQKHENFGEPRQNSKKLENITEGYSSLLGAYNRLHRKAKAFERRYPIPEDKEITERAIELDRERHEMHLKLLEMGENLGKSKNDVLVDIVRQDRTLEEYGLPEFSILKEDDIVETGDWHNPYYFNVDEEARLPSEGDEIKWARNDGKNAISKDKFMLVFAIVPIENYGEDDLDPIDYQVRVKRAEKLAEEIGGKFFEERDSGYHEGSAKILGVILPKKDLEKIAGTIRGNPEKFRLGEEFYSEAELAIMKKEKK